MEYQANGAGDGARVNGVTACRQREAERAQRRKKALGSIEFYAKNLSRPRSRIPHWLGKAKAELAQYVYDEGDPGEACLSREDILLPLSAALKGRKPDPEGEVNAAFGWGPPVMPALRPHEMPMTGFTWPDSGEDGRPFITHTNFRAFVEFQGYALKYDEFAMRYEAWRGTERLSLSDNLVLDLYHASIEHGMKRCKDVFKDWIQYEARKNTYHPLRDYLESLKWDGVKRLDRWLPVYAGCEDMPLNRAFGRCHLVATIGRIYQPGLKHDAMLVLEGPENKGKSLLLRVLAEGTTEALPFGWFTDQLALGDGGRALLEKVAGKWIIEFAELAGLGRREATAIKKFISAQSDADTLKYDKFRTEAARQFTMWGTTNDRTYLKSTTGNRRFWPVMCGNIDIPRLLADRDQLLAEAVAVWKGGGTPHLLPADLWDTAKAAQAEREELLDDPWWELLNDRFSGREKMTKMEVWASLGIFQKGMQTKEGIRLRVIMERMGFKSGRGYDKSGNRERIWER